MMLITQCKGDTHVWVAWRMRNTVTMMSELIITTSAYNTYGDSPMTLVANTVAMTTVTLAVHTLQPHIFYSWYCE